jgi:AraC-like DNA-binding protein
MNATNELLMIKHGSRRKREKGPPGAGLKVETENFSVSYVPPHIIDLKLKTTDNFMVMQLGPSRAEAAFNSDRLRPMQLGPGYPIIGLTGSEFNCQATSTKGVIAFHFSDAYLDSLLHATGGACRFNFNVSRPKFDDHLLQLFRLAKNELFNDQPDAFYIEHLLSASIIRTLSIYTGTHESTPRRVPSARLERAEAYMRSHLQHAIRLNELARVAGMSPYHFARMFKVYFGMAPYQYLQRLRLEKALHLLTSDNRPIKSIAEAVGFSSDSNFGTFFKKHVGMAPVAYRQSYLR